MISTVLTQSSNSFYDVYIPYILRYSILLILFILGRWFDTNLRKKEISRNWYLKVIIEPNINLLDSFKEDIIFQSEKSISKLIHKKAKSFDKWFSGVKKDI